MGEFIANIYSAFGEYEDNMVEQIRVVSEQIKAVWRDGDSDDIQELIDLTVSGSYSYIDEEFLFNYSVLEKLPHIKPDLLITFLEVISHQKCWNHFLLTLRSLVSVNFSTLSESEALSCLTQMKELVSDKSQVDLLLTSTDSSRYALGLFGLMYHENSSLIPQLEKDLYGKDDLKRELVLCQILRMNLRKKITYGIDILGKCNDRTLAIATEEYFSLFCMGFEPKKETVSEDIDTLISVLERVEEKFIVKNIPYKEGENITFRKKHLAWILQSVYLESTTPEDAVKLHVGLGKEVLKHLRGIPNHLRNFDSPEITQILVDFAGSSLKTFKYEALEVLCGRTLTSEQIISIEKLLKSKDEILIEKCFELLAHSESLSETVERLSVAKPKQIKENYEKFLHFLDKKGIKPEHVENGDQAKESVTAEPKENFIITNEDVSAGLKDPVDDPRIAAIIADELERSVAPSDYSEIIPYIQSVTGIEYLLKFLRKVGNGKLPTGYKGQKEFTVEYNMKSLIKAVKPADSDSVETLLELNKVYNISEKQLLTAGMVNRPLMKMIFQSLNYSEAEYAFYDFFILRAYSLDSERYDQLYYEDSSRFCDAQEIRLIYEQCSTQNIQKFLPLFSYSNSDYRTAKLHIDAALGHLDSDKVISTLQEKRTKGYLRAVALLPIANTEELHKRYALIKEFHQESKNQKPAKRKRENSEFEIALSELAINAGYSDKNTLRWNLEGELLLQGSEKEVKKTRKEFLLYCEDSMVQGKSISYNEISQLTAHDLFREVIENIVFQKGDSFGFIRDTSFIELERTSTIAVDESLKIAHVADLHDADLYVPFVSYVKSNKIKEPFKQLKRDYFCKNDFLHVDTITDKDVVTSLPLMHEGFSHKKSINKLKKRGWISERFEQYSREFPFDNSKCTVAITSTAEGGMKDEGYLEWLVFYGIKYEEIIPVESVNPRHFSESLLELKQCLA